MNTKAPKGTLRHEVKALFLQRHVLSAQDVHALLSAKGHATSLVSVYAELKLLLTSKVLIKNRSRYILSLPWILEARSSLERTYWGLLSSSHALTACGLDVASRGVTRRTLVLSSLYQANQLWVQLIFALLARSKTKEVFEYVPRLWFAFIEEAQDAQFQSTFKSVNAVIRIIVGGNSMLDRQPFRRSNRRPSYSCVFESTPRFGTRNICRCLIDETLISIRYPRKLADSIDKIFEQSRSEAESRVPPLLALLLQKQRVTLTIERGTPAAKRYFRLFHHYDFSAATRGK
jgi:hypothetical protein